ncbi:MAG: recombinase family protein [Paracoccaceae bacterium]
MSKPRIRCAIYTRKSSDEGLDQDFNSLDAQREACAAYIASQRHEGWVLDPARYDDGGVSGATLARPGLERLLADIAAGRIGMVVVYKIDRLTRSLADFARLVERLDAASCSFVSVTQAFNTASSMGRLTLNVLLSFAQFEREVTAERIRDKIAASKKKGLWMGGVPPLGYDPHLDPKVRSLVINDAEAQTVRRLYALYDQLGCLGAVARAATAEGLRSKRHRFRTGREQGGGTLSRGQIYSLLRNPIYLGQIRHKAQVWDGQHDAILETGVWERVQEKLQSASGRPRGAVSDPARVTGQAPAPLTGKLRDETGDRLTPTHTRRKGRQIRYYVSNRLISGGVDPRGWRLPARDLEQVVAGLLADHVERLAKEHRLLKCPDPVTSAALTDTARNLAHTLRSATDHGRFRLLARGTVSKGQIDLTLNRDVLAEDLGVAPGDLEDAALAVTAPLQLRRRGIEGKIIAGEPAPSPDPTLLRALSEAHTWVAALRRGSPLHAIAAQAGHADAYIRTRAQLAFLSPELQQAILAGRQPVDLTLARILRRPVPLDWDAQARLYGLRAPG